MWSQDDFTGATSTRIQRLTGLGDPAPGWPALGGLYLASAYLDSFRPSILAADASHYIAVLNYPGGVGSVRALRFGLDGVADPGWPLEGRDLHTSAATNRSYVPDGNGGIHAVWNASGTVRTIHVGSDGALYPGHVAGGIDALGPAAVFSGTDLYSATGRNGGVAILYTDQRPGASGPRVRWLQADGTPDPSELDGSRKVSPDGVGGAARGLLDDGQGGVYAAWVESHGPDFFSYLHLSYLQASTVSVPPVTGAGLALAVGPNPATRELSVRFASQGEGSARVDLLDVAGRTRRSEVVSGSGGQLVRFSRLNDLGAGLYFVRVTQGTTASTARVTIVH